MLVIEGNKNSPGPPLVLFDPNFMVEKTLKIKMVKIKKLLKIKKVAENKKNYSFLKISVSSLRSSSCFRGKVMLS